LLNQIKLKEIAFGTYKWIRDIKTHAGYKDKSLRLFEITKVR